MKKLFVVMGAVVAVAMLAVPLCGCETEISFTTATLSNAQMAASIDPVTLEPVDVVTQYTPESPIFYCSAELSHAPDDTEITAEWIYVQGEAEELAGFVLYEDMITTAGAGYIAFSLENDAGLWPRGDYQVILYIDGKESQSIDFTVE